VDSIALELSLHGSQLTGSSTDTLIGPESSSCCCYYLAPSKPIERTELLEIRRFEIMSSAPPSKKDENHGTQIPSRASRPRLVVTKRKRSGKNSNLIIGRNRKRKPGLSSTARSGISKSSTTTTTIGHARKSPGLPSFHNRYGLSPNPSTGQQNGSCSGDDDDDIDDGYDGDIPCDTLVAFHSIVQADQGLHIPISNNAVQAVLENQIFMTFDENHASSIHRELLELVHSNKVQQLYCQDKVTKAFILTEDYVKAVWDAHHTSTITTIQNPEEVIVWFVSNLQSWRGKTVSKSQLESRWEEFRNANKQDDNAVTSRSTSFEKALKFLLDLQLLIRDVQQSTLNGSCHESHFFLWLPQWGIVLKTWNEARQQLVNLLARSKEISKMNLLRMNRHPCISTQFLLNELVWKGRVEIIERPFGSFVQLVKGK